MEYTILPVTDAPRQSLRMPVSPDGQAFQAKIDLDFLAAADLWFMTVSDAVTGALYVNRIPLICSREELNDLFFPFRWLFQGAGIGSFFCLRAVDSPASENPGRHNLNEFHLIWGDRWKTEG